MPGHITSSISRHSTQVPHASLPVVWVTSYPRGLLVRETPHLERLLVGEGDPAVHVHRVRAGASDQAHVSRGTQHPQPDSELPMPSMSRSACSQVRGLRPLLIRHMQIVTEWGTRRSQSQCYKSNDSKQFNSQPGASTRRRHRPKSTPGNINTPKHQHRAT